MITINEQNISLYQTWHGKKVIDLTPTERMAMEAELRQCATIKKFIYVNDATRTGEITLPRPAATNATNSLTHREGRGGSSIIHINGHTYHSFEEMMRGEANAKNVHTISHARNVTTNNGKVLINGKPATDYNPEEHNLYIIINGNVEGNVDAGEGTVEVHGNIEGDVSAQMGSISCQTIEGDAHAQMGSIRATRIDGDATATMGNIYRG